MGATVNIVASKAKLRMDIKFYIGSIFWAPLQPFDWNPCPCSLPEILTVARCGKLGP